MITALRNKIIIFLAYGNMVGPKLCFSSFTRCVHGDLEDD